MIILVYIVFFLLVTISGIATVLFFTYILDALIRGHYLPTSRRATRALVMIIKQHKPDAKNLYDLGCAHGSLSLVIKKALPYLEIYAVDNSAIRIFFAKLASKILRRAINFKKQDIFDTNVRQADVVYTYLWYDLMPLLEKKLQNELQEGAIVITNTSNFPTWKPIDIVVTCPKMYTMPNFETLFVYVKK